MKKEMMIELMTMLLDISEDKCFIMTVTANAHNDDNLEMIMQYIIDNPNASESDVLEFSTFIGRDL